MEQVYTDQESHMHRTIYGTARVCLVQMRDLGTLDTSDFLSQRRFIARIQLST